MTDQIGNKILYTGFSSDEQESDRGYDSEAAEVTKGGRSFPTNGRPSQRAFKKRKISSVSEEEGSNGEAYDIHSTSKRQSLSEDREVSANIQAGPGDCLRYKRQSTLSPLTPSKKQSTKEQPISHPDRHRNKNASKPGVVYLSSLPPYLKPSALCKLFEQRGFGPITRMFLTPAPSTSTTSSHRTNKRQSYSEGWVEFASKKTAKAVVESMNAQIIGGRKGGWYHDDLLNMRYLSGLGWDELMAQFREERREEEIRREGERERARRETKAFLEGVEKGKVIEGIQRKKKSKREKKEGQEDEDNAEIGGKQREWEQFKVQRQQEQGDRIKGQSSDAISEDVKRVLGKIF